MEWYVYRHDSNKGKIIKYNVINTGVINHLIEKLNRIKKEKGHWNYDDLKAAAKSVYMYYYWGKCEHEIIIKEWVGKEAKEKVDVFDQLMLNWDIFVDHLYDYVIELMSSKGEEENEDVCKDCLCRACKAEHCSGCADCSKADWTIVEECHFYEEKEIPGYWIYNESGDIVCNKCENYPLESNGRVYLSDFCPFCGHRMENCSCGLLVK